MSDNENQNVFFGSEQIPKEDMENRVDSIFTKVASKYDLMNSLMSFGMHKIWKNKAVEMLSLKQVKDEGLIVDLAAGTCDLGGIIKRREGARLRLLCSDKNQDMLFLGRDKMTDQGLIANTSFACFDALKIPLSDNSVDRVIVAFGLRNFSDKAEALAEIHRVLNPGGKCVILEFSKIHHKRFNEIYALYSKNIIPKLGKFIVDSEESYEYLISSIENHPDQIQIISMMKKVGFYKANFFKFLSGLISIHWGYKT